MGGQLLQTKPLAGHITPLVQRQEAAEGTLEEQEREEEEELPLQAKGEGSQNPEPPPNLESRLHALQGGGQPLPQSVRAFFEPRFGCDFSQVRVHTNEQGEASPRRINARAFTFGRNIVFGGGEYSPGTTKGRKLLAHELTHVVQQGIDNNKGPSQLSIQKASVQKIMRSLALDSTFKICHRVLTSRNFKVTQGGLRVVLLLNRLNAKIPGCENHNFWVTLTKSVEWWPDDEIATCEGKTGRTTSFSFGKISSGIYYLTIHRVFDHPYCCLEGDILIFDEPINSDSSSCVRDKDPSAMDIVHGALDIAGFIPLLGAVPDGINAAIYVVEGDWVNAGLSAVAMVPAWGDGVKLGTIVGKSTIKISEKAAIKLGEEGIAKGLKEVKAASKLPQKLEKEAAKAEREVTKLEKEAGEKATGKIEKEEAEKLEKEATMLEKEAVEKASKEAAEKELRQKIAKCEAIWASYKGLGTCRSCNREDTPVERAAKIACLTAVIMGRRQYLAERCDYVLPGSIARGSAVAEKGHLQQVAQLVKMMEKCFALPTK